MLLDEIKWQLKFPSRFAMRDHKRTYLQKVQEETQNFLKTRIQHNHLKPKEGLHLDLSVKEAEILVSASQSVRKLSESGELAKIHDKFEKVSTGLIEEFQTVRNQIGEILIQIEHKENEVVEQLRALGLEKLRIHVNHYEDPNFYDVMGLSFGDPSFNNLIMVESAIEQEQYAHIREQLIAVKNKLHAYLGLQARYFEIKVELREEYIKKVGKDDKEALEELKRLINYRDRYQKSYNRYELAQSEQTEFQVYINILGETYNTRIRPLIEKFTEYEKTYNDRERIYHHYMAEEQNEALQTFREELFQHLAGSIVVKEHRQRYQKEQFERYMASMQAIKLWGNGLSLRQLTENYADLVEHLIELSHNSRAPHIEANYDDFGERTVRPLNATIFYYFFSADRAGKRLAKLLLSAARYPNDRVRRAYMNFFA